MEYFAISFVIFGGVSEYLCFKGQRLLDWTQHQLIFSFHALLPASKSLHISFLLPLYTQLQVWRSRKIISTSTLLHQKIISVLGGEYLPLSSACMTVLWVSAQGFLVSVMPNWSNVLSWLESLDLWQLPMTISSVEWASMDCNVSEIKFYSIIFYFLSSYETDHNFKRREELICTLKY